MRNAGGGQAFGNRMEIRPLTEEAFRKYVLPRLRTGYASSLAEYQRRLPNVTHYSVLWRDGDKEWRFEGVGSLEEREAPARNSRWALEVNEFDSPAAIEFGRTADRDV